MTRDVRQIDIGILRTHGLALVDVESKTVSLVREGNGARSDASEARRGA